MLSSRFAGIPISSSTIDGPGVPQLLNRGEQTTRAVTGSGGRLHFGMVAGIKSERWPTSNRNPWPDCRGIRKIGVDKGGSLVMWRRCFPNARVTGVDIRDVPCVPGCQVFQGDSRNSDWVRTAFPPASIDVVIDDGDHSLESQIATF